MAFGGLPAPTKAQAELFDRLINEIGCAVCLFYCRHEDGSRVEGSVGEIHHLLSGGNRISHWHVIPLCRLHHMDGKPGKPGNPSRHSMLGQYGKAEFEQAYAGEMEILVQCEEWINQFYVTGLLTDEQAPKADDNSASANADVEPVACNEPVPEDEVTSFDTPVHIDFVHYRYRLADPDGLSVKAVIDGIVAAGILADDTAKEIAAITHRQVKIPRSEEERTVIAIEEVA